MLKITNRLQTLSPAYRRTTRQLATDTLARLDHIHAEFQTSSAKLLAAIHSELRFKRALNRIELKLAAASSAASWSQWVRRKKACEVSLNAIRKKVNTARHGWAALETEAKAIASRLNRRIRGSSSNWADTLRQHICHLTGELEAFRRPVAQLMTESALIHDGHHRIVSPELALRLDRLGAQFRA